MNTLAPPSPTSWDELLLRLTVNDLKNRARLLPGHLPSSSKAALVEAMRGHLCGAPLRTLWAGLDETQQLAVAEAVHGGGALCGDAFAAKYGRRPQLYETKRDQNFYGTPSGPPTALMLLFYPTREGVPTLPDEVREELATFVARPAPMRLTPLEALPAEADGPQPEVHLGEQAALQDVPVLLRLVSQGRLQVSEKTALPGLATQRAMAEVLSGGDYYRDAPDADRMLVGPIKGFAWPLLLQAAALAVRQGGKLGLAPAGKQALTAAPAEVLRHLWQKWLESDLIDEFSRVDEIKGQKSRDAQMTPVGPRRQAIQQALAACPIGAWVAVDELSRYMQGQRLLFDVTYNPRALYIDEPECNLSDIGLDGWNVLQLRYLLCVLMEYAAPLGLVDVACVPPHGARRDRGSFWSVDEIPFLSCHDGLRWIRLTPLGAYCLGLHDRHVPAAAQGDGVRLAVMPSLLVNLMAGVLQRHETMLLETWAEPLSPQSWRLDRQRALAAIECGQDSGELRAFLQARDDQPLPDAVESFIAGCQTQGRALRMDGTALLVACRDAETAAAIASHQEMAGLCLRAGDTHLAVRPAHERKFRERVRGLGFGVQG